MELYTPASTLIDDYRLEEIWEGDVPVDDEDYQQFIETENGRYTRDNYYHFFTKSDYSRQSLHYWNGPTVWKHYFGLDDNHFVFAEDVFGHQYYFDKENDWEVYVLVLSTGKKLNIDCSFEFFIDGLDDLAEKETVEEFFMTRDEKWAPYSHLSYKQPLSVGGRAQIENMQQVDSLTNLIFLGQINEQIKSLPKGASVQGVEFEEGTGEVRLRY